MCIMWTGSSFHPFPCTSLLAILLCQYHTLIYFLNINWLPCRFPLSLLLFTHVAFSTSSSCFLYRQLLSFKENEAGPYRQVCKESKHFFLLCPSFRKKHSWGFSFWRLNLSKTPVSVHKVSTAFTLKFTLVTSFWPKRQHIEEQGK